MDISTSRPSSSNTQVDRYPLLLERMDRPNDHEHKIDITSNNSTSSSSSTDDSQEDGPRSSTWETTYRASSSTAVRGPNPRTATYTRRRDGYSHRRRSPLNSMLWISVELLVTVGQIVASIVVLSLSRDEHPEALLFAWVVGYACGCVATLPILYWRFRNRNQNVQQDSVQPHQGPSQSNITERLSYTSISISQSSNEENVHSTESDTRSQVQQPLNARLNGLMEHFKMALDCYFAVWFVVGNVWIFGGHSTPADAPKLYRLCIVFLTFSCIGYAMPFILCATICCCLPCIISVLGFREDFSHTRGASEDFINTLPTFKFKLNNSGDDNDCSIANQDGVLAAGTEKERVISGEDAACCICLNKYVDDDDIRELPCSHVFHVECIDKWLKINALCPLCKCDVFENNSNTSPSAVESSQQYLQECG